MGSKSLRIVKFNVERMLGLQKMSGLFSHIVIAILVSKRLIARIGLFVDEKSLDRLLVIIIFILSKMRFKYFFTEQIALLFIPVIYHKQMVGNTLKSLSNYGKIRVFRLYNFCIAGISLFILVLTAWYSTVQSSE